MVAARPAGARRNVRARRVLRLLRGRRPSPPRAAAGAVSRGAHSPGCGRRPRPDAFSASDLARAALLLAACSAIPADDHVAIATEAFRKGDSAERVALLRALPLLPEPARFTALAVEACRTHVLEVFAAIACDNPFPSSYFSEPSFNQLVVKCLFLELPLERVHRLAGARVGGARADGARLPRRAQGGRPFGAGRHRPD